MKLSFSVVKDLYKNLHSFDIPMKELIKKFLQDKPAIKAYVADLRHDIKVVGDDLDMTSYKKGVQELGALLDLVQEDRYKIFPSYKGSFKAALSLYSIWDYGNDRIEVKYFGGSHRSYMTNKQLNSWLDSLGYNTL